MRRRPPAASRSCASSAGRARIVAGVPQLIADLGFSRPTAGAPGRTRRAGASRSHGARRLGRPSGGRAELLAGRATVDELVAATDLPVATVLATLMLLERRGLAVGIHGRYRPAGALLGRASPIRCGRR